MKPEDQRFEEAFDKIIRWYRSDGSVPLPDHLQVRLLIWKQIRAYILTYKPLTDTEIVVTFAKDNLRSEPQLYRDIRDAKRFFGSMEEVNKEFERTMLIAQIKSLRATALEAGKFAVAAKCDSNLIVLRGFGEEEKDEDNTGKTIVLNLSSNPKLVGAKENPNLLAAVTKYIGEKAKRELMIDDDAVEILKETESNVDRDQ